MGESRIELIKRIEDTYGDISKARAATIARQRFMESLSMEHSKVINRQVCQ